MGTKWLIVILIIVLLLVITFYIAKRAVKSDNVETKKEIEKNISEDARRTIEEAKSWIEHDMDGSGGESMGDILNKNSLGELLALKPVDEDYKEYVAAVGLRVKELFEDYQFFMYEPDKADLVSGYLLQFQILGHEQIYNELFVHAMDAGLEMDKIDKYFYEALKAGEIIPLGDNIILEEEGTGISPIKSGDDVRVIISFITEEYKERQEEAEAEEKEDE